MSIINPVSIAQRASSAGGGAPPSGPGAKVRILVTADRLFYNDGIRSVGIDRLISESSVTKATFYKHYGSKDRLISEYLNGRHRAVDNAIAELQSDSTSPLQTMQRIVTAIDEEIHRAGFRGCAFINAAAEYADPRSAPREIISAHRDWYTDTVTEFLRAAGHPLPGDAADEFILARDGAMTGGYASDPVSAAAALHRVADRIFTEIP